jgi:hypothetical protein
MKRAAVLALVLTGCASVPDAPVTTPAARAPVFDAPAAAVDDYVPAIDVCRADLDGDGVVNTIDLGIMRGDFGCTGECVADIDGDGVVNTIDLGRMRQAFFRACLWHGDGAPLSYVVGRWCDDDETLGCGLTWYADHVTRAVLVRTDGTVIDRAWPVPLRAPVKRVTPLLLYLAGDDLGFTVDDMRHAVEFYGWGASMDPRTGDPLP